ncbi:MAG: hypothetical protein IH946_06755, partial [Bacteroidetes bacterium]|nr:hypothetical protein [Bacteroidota bacterium]
IFNFFRYSFLKRIDIELKANNKETAKKYYNMMQKKIPPDKFDQGYDELEEFIHYVETSIK